MKYSEATNLIKELSKKYSINSYNNYLEIYYKSSPIAWVNKQEQFFGRINILDSEFDKLPYSHKLYMILSELAMTPISEREEHKWNVVIGVDDYGLDEIICWEKKGFGYQLYKEKLYSLKSGYTIFTDDEFNDLIKYIKTLPDGEFQAKVAEHGKTEIKGE